MKLGKEQRYRTGLKNYVKWTRHIMSLIQRYKANIWVGIKP